MDSAEQLRVLQDAKGHPAKLALATVDIVYSELPTSERAALKEALETAAIPHWCDENILAGLLKIPKHESGVWLARLRELRILEPFPARGASAVNVHEAARLPLRKLVAEDQPRFRKVSARATAYFAEDLTPAGRIEWIYHLLCGDPERGANELENMERYWTTQARPEDYHALAAALGELEDTGLVHGRARVWTMLVTSWQKYLGDETAHLVDRANTIRDLARSVADMSAEADALCLLGAVLKEEGKLTQSKAALEAALVITQHFAVQAPTNRGRQRDVAVVQQTLGQVLSAQGKYREAQAAFEAAVAIYRRVSYEPSHAGWQQDLARILGKLGRVLKEQGKFPEAQAAFEAALAINRSLTDQDPTHANWLDDLALAHHALGILFEAQGKLTEAQAAFEAALPIFQRLTEQDTSSAQWQQALARTHDWLGYVFKAQGKFTEAQAAYDAAAAINKRFPEVNH